MCREGATEEGETMVVEMSAWTYEGYWNVVLGSTRTARDVVREFGLMASTRSQLRKWLLSAEREAWAQSGKPAEFMTDAWNGYRTYTLDKLQEAAEGVMREYRASAKDVG